MYFKNIAYALKETITLNSKYRPKTTYTPVQFFAMSRILDRASITKVQQLGLNLVLN